MLLTLKRTKVPIMPENDVCLITGDGRTLPADLGAFLSLGISHDVMSIGRSVKKYPGRVLHWANVDGNESKWWAEHLPLVNDGQIPIRHSLGEFPWYDVDWDDGKDLEAAWYGSSSLFSVLACLALGYQKVVLAGCPLNGEGHWFHGPEWTGPDWRVEDYQAWRDFAKTDEARKVTSLSGFTKEVLS
jgi:hypothetical protein